MAKVGRLARRRDREQHRRQSELAADVIRDPDRYAVVLRAKEAPVLTQRAELEGEAETHVVAAAAIDLHEVGLRKVPGASELLVIGIGRQKSMPHSDTVRERARPS